MFHDFNRMRGETVAEEEADASDLEPADQKTLKRLEKLRDMVLFRYGSTGVWGAVQVGRMIYGEGMEVH